MINAFFTCSESNCRKEALGEVAHRSFFEQIAMLDNRTLMCIKMLGKHAFEGHKNKAQFWQSHTFLIPAPCINSHPICYRTDSYFLRNVLNLYVSVSGKMSSFFHIASLPSEKYSQWGTWQTPWKPRAGRLRGIPSPHCAWQSYMFY